MPLTKIEIPSENKLGSLPGYISSGDFKAGVIVIQEWWGVNDHIKGVAERWYADKFVVLVPDFYRGKIGHNHEEAGHIFKGLDWQGAVQDIQGAVNYLKSKGIQKVGVTGFCMGGALSIAAAVFTDGISASAPFYGIPKAELLNCDAGKARVPLQLHFGTKDSAVGFSDPETQDKLEKVLKENGRDYVFYRYEGAEHAFANETSPGRYNAEYAKLAHQRTLEFFDKHLN